MDGFGETLKKKAGPLPVWGWVAIGTVLLAVFLIWRKSKTAGTSTNSQGSTDLTSASELANMFNVAGLMPYQGGDVYVNVPTPSNPKAPPTTPTPVGKPPVKTPPPKTGGKVPPKPQATVKVKKGDTLSSIAKKYGISWQDLYAYNITKGVRPASTIATLKSRGPNLIVSGETILVPPKGWKP